MISDKLRNGSVGEKTISVPSVLIVIQPRNYFVLFNIITPAFTTDSSIGEFSLTVKGDWGDLGFWGMTRSHRSECRGF